MLSVNVSYLVILVAPLLIMLMGALVSLKLHKKYDKCSPYECGFDPKSSARVPLSNRFFIMAVLFLVFDVEVLLLFPAPLLAFWNMNNLLQLGGFLTILILGLLHEWNEGSLSWSK